VCVFDIHCAEDVPFACPAWSTPTPFALDLSDLQSTIHAIQEEMRIIAARHDVLVQHLGANDIPFAVLPLATRADFEHRCVMK
jgi:hypothetical protein